MHRKEFWAKHDAIDGTKAEIDAQRTQLHREYYAQYVNKAAPALVRSRIGEKELEASTDPHFNDIPLLQWDRLVCWLPKAVVDKLHANGDWLSLGTGVCILKEAARQILEGKA